MKQFVWTGRGGVGYIHLQISFPAAVNSPNQPASWLCQAVAKIGANLCCLYDEAEEQKKFLSVITDAEWGIKLGKLEVCGWKPLCVSTLYLNSLSCREL